MINHEGHRVKRKTNCSRCCDCGILASGAKKVFARITKELKLIVWLR